MKLKAKINYFFNNISEKHRVAIENPHTGEELWYMLISPLNLLAGVGAFALLTFIVVSTLFVYTPVLDMIPGYPGNKSRQMLIESIMRLDSMENRLSMWNEYQENLTTIMDGRVPINTSGALDSVSTEKAGLTARIAEDSILRLQMELEGIYKLGEQSQSKGLNKANMGLFTPIKGSVRKKFDPKNGILGVEIVSLPNESVLAAKDGTVILSTWTPELGYVMYIQHTGDFVTVYKHNSKLIRSVGDRVKAGEVIGYTGAADVESGKQGALTFEVWYKGTPVDPANYIVF